MWPVRVQPCHRITGQARTKTVLPTHPGSRQHDDLLGSPYAAGHVLQGGHVAQPSSPWRLAQHVDDDLPQRQVVKFVGYRTTLAEHLVEQAAGVGTLQHLTLHPAHGACGHDTWHMTHDT